MTERNLDFDTIVNRKNTMSLKYDFAKKRGFPEDALSLWVADMDFKTSSYIEDALVERVHHGIFGYTETQTEYFKAVQSWVVRHHEWNPKEEWLIKTPGVVFALAMAVKAFTNEDDAVLIQQPVYYPFSEVIRDNKRKFVSSDLYLADDNRYKIDFKDFEKKIVDEKIKLFILCSPHNPVGRVWTKNELETLGDICVRHNVIVVADEIHNDFIFSGEHKIFASIKKEFEEISVICTSPSKTFNLASMLISNIFIPNINLRAKFQKQVDAAGISQLSALGIVATIAAYTKGDEWYFAMKNYVKANIDFMSDFVSKNLPSVKMINPEGTYLVWLDFRSLGFDADALDDLIINKARLWLDSGKIFGKCGKGFQRINVACPKSVLCEALERIRLVIF